MDKTMINDSELNEVSGGTKIPYVVVSGDTLSAIAQKNNVSLADLMRWNQFQRKRQKQPAGIKPAGCFVIVRSFTESGLFQIFIFRFFCSGRTAPKRPVRSGKVRPEPRTAGRSRNTEAEDLIDDPE